MVSTIPFLPPTVGKILSFELSFFCHSHILGLNHCNVSGDGSRVVLKETVKGDDLRKQGGLLIKGRPSQQPSPPSHAPQSTTPHSAKQVMID